MVKKASKKASNPPHFVRKVVPDRLDLRDRPYMPSVAVIPGQELAPRMDMPVLNQHDTSACTGFALASVIYHLQCAAKREPATSRVSPYMLYSMARRYDEFPGKPNIDTGSSARGAMKGWFKFGACAQSLWPGLKMPKAAKDVESDWWQDAVRRPLGAYYRVDPRAVTDMHVALNEVGILYVTAACHGGWFKGLGVTADGLWPIPPEPSTRADGAHAFVIIGYDRKGFIIQNSWGAGWGTDGRALLRYEDWEDNAMDCWVAQLGVVTDLHEEIARSAGLRSTAGKVHIAGDPTLQAREIGPYIIDMENDGRLSNTGDFRTNDSDIDLLVNQLLDKARADFGLAKGVPVDIAIYAHGGLTSEKGAAATVTKWMPALYEAKIFPIFLMWETDLWTTLKDRLENKLGDEPRMAGGPVDTLKKWWDERLEKLLARPGTMIWGEMKQNAEAISKVATSGGIRLYSAAMKSPNFADPSKVRLHLIGHSAGAIVHSYVVDQLCGRGWKFETVNFMAPAVRTDVFEACIAPALTSGKVKQLNQFHLSDDVELKDPTCKPILGYGRSLLYLVSKSFEHGIETPILGMEKHFKELTKPPNVRAWTAPGVQSKSTTHGGFDDDTTTMNSVIALIQGKSI